MLRNAAHKWTVWVLLLFLISLCGISEAATFVVSLDQDNKNIQETINSANDGDRIIVKSGTYNENLDVSKVITLIGLDTGKGKPILNAGGRASCIVVSADHVVIEGFNVTNSGRLWKDAGIKVTSKHCVVRSNDVSNNEYGIVLDGFENCRVIGNKICSNDVGIALYSSENSTIENNFACNNTFGGILLSKSKNNSIKNNNASLNRWAGIILGESNDNSVLNNVARFNENEGIWLLRSNCNTIRGNRPRDNYIFGIRLHYSNRNLITNNRARYNLDGVSLENSNDNFLAGNNASNNIYGIYVDKSFNNMIYMNNFANNVENVHSWNSTNFWNSTERLGYKYNNVPYTKPVGNFWSDYSGPDPFGDGLGDDPKPISPTERDEHPLRFSSEKYVLNT